MLFNMKETASYTVNSPDTCFQLTVVFLDSSVLLHVDGIHFHCCVK